MAKTAIHTIMVLVILTMMSKMIKTGGSGNKGFSW